MPRRDTTRAAVAVAGLAVAYAAALAPAAVAYCDPEGGRPCETACDEVAARYGAAAAKWVGDGAPPFPLMCPQN